MSFPEQRGISATHDSHFAPRYIFLRRAEKDLASDASSSVTEAEMRLNQIDRERPLSTYVSK